MSNILHHINQIENKEFESLIHLINSDDINNHLLFFKILSGKQLSVSDIICCFIYCIKYPFDLIENKLVDGGTTDMSERYTYYTGFNNLIKFHISFSIMQQLCIGFSTNSDEKPSNRILYKSNYLVNGGIPTYNRVIDWFDNEYKPSAINHIKIESEYINKYNI